MMAEEPWLPALLEALRPKKSWRKSDLIQQLNIAISLLETQQGTIVACKKAMAAADHIIEIQNERMRIHGIADPPRDTVH
jgi:hypothetical protein